MAMNRQRKRERERERRRENKQKQVHACTKREGSVVGGSVAAAIATASN